MDVFWAAPPVSRTLAAAALITSLLVYGALLSASRVIFYLPWILKFPPELWRLCTPFLITGPKLGILLDPYFLYTYGSSLETESPRFSQPGDFFTYVLLVCCVILFTSVAITGGYIFTPALVLALAYTYAQENPNRKVTYFVVSFKVKWLPYVMLLLTFILQSPEAALQQANGLVAAHLLRASSKSGLAEIAEDLKQEGMVQHLRKGNPHRSKGVLVGRLRLLDLVLAYGAGPRDEG
ncbi:MAG: hypothetical protein M1817_006492 [Caeruleum heppii]|nr:MAG: hypothetical protein M1817_006492 [Caeruleum heppii]